MVRTLSAVLLPLALVGSALAAKFSQSSISGGTKGFGNTVPNKFIVEVADPADIPGKRSLDSRSRDLGFKVEKEFNSPGLFLGSLLTLEDVAKVLDIPGVKAIRPVKLIPAPKPVKKHIVTGLDDPQVPPDSESTHILTGVDKLHAQGITGHGIKIGIIDTGQYTGIDFTNPFLGGGFGPGFKVIGGFDFVGDNFSSNTPQPDPNPLDQCNGHGTHVAGIIGANPGNPFNISGVAFNASINAYRIFGCTGDVSDDIIIEALLRGVSDGNHILTMSLGGPDGWTESSSAVLSSRIAATGKIVTIAAGNDGAKGSWYTSSPGNGINAISVASLDNTVIPLQNATVHGVAHDPITYFSTFPLPVNGTLPIFATSNDTTIVDDACNPLPDDTPDLSSFVVIVRRGTCTFVQKLTNIAAKGGQVVLIYDNGSGFDAIDVGNFTTATLIQAADGAFLVNEFASGASVSLSFPQSGGSFEFPDSAGGLISSFTSYGPSNDFFFKPAIAAPGGNILSTFPVPLGTFAVLSGTSMATPFMAGVSALLFSVKGTAPEVGLTARTLFETTAQRVPSSHTDGDPLQTVTQQGAGLVDAFKAIHADVIVSPGELITNDTAHFKGLQTFTVKNIGNKAKSFKISHIPAGTALTFQPGTIFPADGPVPLSTNFATVKFSETSFTVHPGQTQQITAHITPPTGLDPTTFPVFSGFIEIANAEESFQVTYLGLAGALKDVQVVDDTDVFFGVNLPVLTDAAGNFLTGPTNFTFVGDDAPTVLMRLAFGSPKVLFDLVDPNINITTTLNKRSDSEVPVADRSIFSFPNAAKSGTFAQVHTLGSLFEADFQPRNSDEDDGTGFNTLTIPSPQFANGTTIPNGLYRILLRALKVTGDPTKEEDFESWLSPVIGIEAPA
ncbi:subtilisin-like protease [Trametes cingulata]|nr:subtilisin-like protease [Trametes cingulata]